MEESIIVTIIMMEERQRACLKLPIVPLLRGVRKWTHISCELDNDYEALPFLKEIKEIPILDNFVRSKIDKYNGKDDQVHHFNEYLIRMSLKVQD